MQRGLYIHIPFCKHICNYCDFCKMVITNEELIKDYMNKLYKEFDLYKEYLHDIKSIYIGGGTPNALPNNLLEDLFKKIESYNLEPLEYSIEINPELLTEKQVELFKKYNIKRVSIGAEALDDNILKYLGRHHTHENIINSINLLRNAGIENINLDFIYAHPMDNKELLEKELDEVISLNIPHLSFYTLILEDKTVFSYKKVKMLEDDQVADLMDLVNEKLKDYHHYEISNYSFKGFESIHNKLYWESGEYIGLGMGASGYINGVRYDNPRRLNDYLKEYKCEENKLDILDKKSEYMILGLRMLDGVSRSLYEKKFNSKIEDDFNLDEILKYKLIEINGDIIKLTYNGYKLANQVFEVFI